MFVLFTIENVCFEFVPEVLTICEKLAKKENLKESAIMIPGLLD